MPKSRPTGATDVTEYFVMRDSTNHAPKTDVTITDIDIYYQEQGAAQSAKADLTALAAANSAHADNKGYHCGNAVYRIDWPDAAFDGGAGKSVILIVVCTGCDTIYREIQLSPPVDIIAISGDTTAADNCELMFDGTGYAGGTTKLGVDTVAISGDSTAADNLEAAADGTGYNLGGGDIVAASVTAGVTLANDAITAAKFDESTAFPLKSADTGATAVARTGADSDTLETLSNQLDGMATDADVADAILDEALSGHTTAGTLGKAIADILADTGTDGVQVAGIKAAALADLFDTDSGTTYASAVSGSVVKEIADNAGGSALTAGAIADAVWNETVADHSGVGSTGAALAAAGGSGDPWSTAIPGSYAAGTAGQIVGDNVDGLAALIGSGGITVVSPVSEDGGTITIVQGDDYNASDGRALEWSSDNWPDITGAAITLYIEDSGGTYSEAGSVVASGAGTQTVRVEPPNTDTTNLDAGFQKFHVEAVLTSSRVVTLATGVAHVIADIS